MGHQWRDKRETRGDKRGVRQWRDKRRQTEGQRRETGRQTEGQRRDKRRQAKSQWRDSDCKLILAISQQLSYKIIRFTMSSNPNSYHSLKKRLVTQDIITQLTYKTQPSKLNQRLTTKHISMKISNTSPPPPTSHHHHHLRLLLHILRDLAPAAILMEGHVHAGGVSLLQHLCKVAARRERDGESSGVSGTRRQLGRCDE